MAEVLIFAKADGLSPGQIRRVETHGCSQEIMPVAWGEVQQPIRRGARPCRAPKHRPLQCSPDGSRYPDSGLAKAVECDRAQG